MYVNYMCVDCWRKKQFSAKNGDYILHFGRAETITVVRSKTRTCRVIISHCDDTNVAQNWKYSHGHSVVIAVIIITIIIVRA